MDSICNSPRSGLTLVPLHQHKIKGYCNPEILLTRANEPFRYKFRSPPMERKRGLREQNQETRGWAHCPLKHEACVVGSNVRQGSGLWSREDSQSGVALTTDVGHTADNGASCQVMLRSWCTPRVPLSAADFHSCLMWHCGDPKEKEKEKQFPGLWTQCCLAVCEGVGARVPPS